MEILEQVHDLDDIEDMAVQLATLAGAEIVRTFGGIFTVRYKTGDAGKLSVRDRSRRSTVMSRSSFARVSQSGFHLTTSSARRWMSVRAAARIACGPWILSTARLIS